MYKLPTVKIISESILAIKKNYKFSLFALLAIATYYILSRSLGIAFRYYELERRSFIVKNTFTIMLIMKYFLLFVLTRRYFEKYPLWTKQSMTASLKKALAIFVLYMAFSGLVIILYKAISLLAIPDFISEALNSRVYTKTWGYIYYIISIFLIVIPSFAWVSSVVGKDSSITSAFFETSGNYIKVILLFVIAYLGIEFLQFSINKFFDFIREYIYFNELFTYSKILKIVSKITNFGVYVFFFLLKTLIFFKTYEFFYEKKD